MKKITTVSIDEIKDLGGYIRGLMLALGSMRTLKQFHAKAHSIGILPDEPSLYNEKMEIEMNRLEDMYIAQIKRSSEFLDQSSVDAWDCLKRSILTEL